ncbi:sugar ABC transporter ATP-binding protein [Actinomadura roseirufa]|uniref:sugar ABC transporter ATP-binding protein n=1 Tax=Actinomadura roseirufa TaxID=2094049 RepID=UPI0013F14973|nr:sugar ABC transporter ATP-binding protein [Actinomadura roseirufa]
MPPPVMSLRSVHKRFGANEILHGIDLDLETGGCVALAGENGSGKSTLAKIMSGVEQPTRGRISWDGREVRLPTPRAARDLGVAVIPQELAYVGGLSALENIALANWPKRHLIASRRRYRAWIGERFAELGLDLDLHSPMDALGLAERQLVEIAKALLRDARLIILDEPTASLHRPEARRLLTLLADCKARGVALVYISHHLEECTEIADQITVLRHGRVAADLPAASATPEEIVGHLLGPDHSAAPVPAQARPPAAEEADGPALRLTGWRSGRVPALDGVDLSVRAGEVVSVFGILGSGAETLARSLGGHQAGTAGRTEVCGRVLRSAPRSPAAARRLGIGYVPAERKTDGIATVRSIAEHLTLMTSGRVSRLGFTTRRKEEEIAAGLAKEYGVRCTSPRQRIGELSGGNQQKVLLASRIAAAPAVLVLHEPTRGVDIAARAQIHRLIVAAARAGAAVVVVTCDATEAVAVGDRVVVIRDGRVRRDLGGADKNENAVITAATGGTQ